MNSDHEVGLASRVTRHHLANTTYMHPNQIGSRATACWLVRWGVMSEENSNSHTVVLYGQRCMCSDVVGISRKYAYHHSVSYYTIVMWRRTYTMVSK